tara:strand:- start:372 stop:488 length:117 start_codon:yes stop_codon:yes gene_type:complete
MAISSFDELLLRPLELLVPAALQLSFDASARDRNPVRE